MVPIRFLHGPLGPVSSLSGPRCPLPCLCSTHSVSLGNPQTWHACSPAGPLRLLVSLSGIDRQLTPRLLRVFSQMPFDCTLSKSHSHWPSTLSPAPAPNRCCPWYLQHLTSSPWVPISCLCPFPRMWAPRALWCHTPSLQYWDTALSLTQMLEWKNEGMGRAWWVGSGHTGWRGQQVHWLRDGKGLRMLDVDGAWKAEETGTRWPFLFSSTILLQWWKMRFFYHVLDLVMGGGRGLRIIQWWDYSYTAEYFVCKGILPYCAEIVDLINFLRMIWCSY